jgi:hypothetical protein
MYLYSLQIKGDLNKKKLTTAMFPADTRDLKPIDMEVCYWALLFMPLVFLHHLLNVFVQLANKREFKQKRNYSNCIVFSLCYVFASRCLATDLKNAR